MLLGAIVALILWLGHNVVDNMRARGLASGFDFLSRPAGFDISQSLIAYSPQSTHTRVFLVGALNTLLVAVLSIVTATLVGLVVGMARVSNNFLARNVGAAYVELVRNVPLPIQLLVWYALLLLLPPARQAWAIDGVAYLTNRGLYLPKYVWGQGFDLPHDAGFDFAGGLLVSPPLIALWAALSVYTAAFISEIVRGGLKAVSPGQMEAARSLGLGHGRAIRLVVLPQAFRVMVPPLASQYLNLTKNSSLAVIVGYPDLVAVFGGTSLNQTGQAIETLSLVMLFYLVCSLSVSLFMNWYNAQSAVWATPR